MFQCPFYLICELGLKYNRSDILNNHRYRVNFSDRTLRAATETFVARRQPSSETGLKSSGLGLKFLRNINLHLEI